MKTTRILNVLFVSHQNETNRLVRRACHELYWQVTHTLRSVTSIKQACQLVQYDVCLMDCSTKTVDIFECHSLLSDRHIAMVLIGSQDEQQIYQQLCKEDVLFMLKPFSKQKLLSYLNKISPLQDAQPGSRADASRLNAK